MQIKQSNTQQDLTPARKSSEHNSLPDTLYNQAAQIIHKAGIRPNLVSPADVALLQRTIGNKAIQQLVSTPVGYAQAGSFHQTDSSNPVQLSPGKLKDREVEAQFYHTQTYLEFQNEVRHWVAQRVRSDRVPALVPDGSLLGYYNAFHPGQPIVLRIHFHSNGYSFQKLSFIIPGEEIVVTPSQEDSEPSRGYDSKEERKQQNIKPNSPKSEQSNLPQLPDWVWDSISSQFKNINTLLSMIPGLDFHVTGVALGIRGSASVEADVGVGGGVDHMFIVDWINRRLTPASFGFGAMGIGLGIEAAAGIVVAYRLTPEGETSQRSTETYAGPALSAALDLIIGGEFSISMPLLFGKEGWISVAIDVGPQVGGSVSGGWSAGGGVSYDKEGITPEGTTGMP
ncbi:MAG: hypothetical protein KDD92_11180 [Caldilineaceae bacterium]|nr:hypothetical protein [Caldilineaceae bacterium]